MTGGVCLLWVDSSNYFFDFLESFKTKIYIVCICIHKYMETTVRLNSSVKNRLDSFKVHSRESYNDVIARMTENININIDEDSLKETIEVLSNPETMRNIAEALERFNNGNSGISWEDIKKEQGLNV